jgi:hypothetical protein
MVAPAYRHYHLTWHCVLGQRRQAGKEIEMTTQNPSVPKQRASAANFEVPAA